MIDKSWMKLRNRLSNEYKNGVKEFLDFAFARVEHENMIPCPCVKCNNVWNKTREEVDDDLIINGIVKSYNFWIMHGEDNDELVSDEIVDDDDGSVDMDSTNEILEARFGATNVEMWRNGEFNGNGNEQPNEEATKFFKLLRDASEKVYPGCEKYSKLSFIVKFLHLKCLYHCSNECATMLLKLIGDVLPDSHTLPNNYYEAKKIVRDLGLDYEKIDACKNDCMLYWKDNANDEHCAICGESRWKLDGGARKGKKIPHKTLRYFPLTPRLQRLFMSKTTASEMTWHHEKRVDDGMLRHPADSKAWKHFNETHESFAIEPRNIRLGLASDGFNPFGNMSTSYSIWPVLLVPYNLPPWMCMKQPYTMLSLLIPGPNGPGNNIDIYLQPLIDELKMLWETGVETYDSYREQNFRMHAAVLWTINDFPAYGNLSGWVNKGKLACPSCNVDTQSMYLKNGGKTCYLGHRRFLPIKHRWRLQSNLFDGTKEKRHRPRQFSGDDVLDQLRHLHFPTFGKTNNKRKHNDPVSKYGWKKKSIFFELPYWRTLLLRHNLDVMHIEKNVCDNVLGLLMNTGAKDNIKARLDLKDMGIREELHPILKENKIEIPTASYTLSPNEKKAFCEYLKELKFPDGYASNISRCVNVSERKICGLKSHDSHVLLERFLPIAIRGLLPKDVCDALIELCTFFKEICCKVLSMDDLDRLESRIEFTLCKLEMIFPPAFFDIMEHLPIHLASEAKIAGPVQYRWMYQIERYMHKLKKFVRNKARPEGSIAEGYIADECLTFCSKHLHGIETRFNRVPRNYEGVDLNSNEVGFSIFEKTGRPLHKVSTVNSRQLELNEWLQARIYVLKNCDEVTPFLEEYRQEIEMMGVKNIEAKLNQDFPEWFEKRVTQWNNESNHLLSLAQGPAQVVTCYKGYIINGFRFHINDRATQRKTQNSGVVVKGECVTGDHDYYGVLTDIVELSYLGGHRVVLFKCDWWDVDTPERGIMKDAYGFTSVNVNRTLKTNEPFVLSCQAEQVYYVKDIKNTNWLVVVKNEPRDLYNMPNEENEEEREDGEEEFANNTEPYQQNESSIHHQRTDATYDDVVDVIWRRNDVQEEQVDANVLSQHTSNDIVEDDVLFDDDDDDDDESDVANSMTSDD